MRLHSVQVQILLASSHGASDLHVLTMQLLCARAGFLWLLLLNAFTAYFQNLSNFLVTKATSPLTLQVRNDGARSNSSG